MDHLEGNDLLPNKPHGFRKQRSCKSLLVEFIDEVVKGTKVPHYNTFIHLY